MKRKGQIFLAATLCLLTLACNSGVEEVSSCNLAETYNQPFKTDVAWIVLEWNCSPIGWGSGFLTDREKGILFTNKHVSNVFNRLGRGSHKIFFNGRVYNAAIIKTDILSDAALVQITDQFNYSEFTDPAPFAQEKVKVGDKVVVEGFHIHPYQIRQSDIEDGYDFPLIPIFRDHYKSGTLNLDKEREIVFEKLEAEVSEVDKKIMVREQGTGITQVIRNTSNLYIEIKTVKDHKFSFGGLSGTVVRNTKGETIGIFTAAPRQEYDFVDELPNGFVMLQQVFKTAYVTPIGATKNLRQYIK